MAILTTQKAYDLALKLNEDYGKRLFPLTSTLSFDTNGFPVVSVGPGTAGGQNAVVRIKPTDQIGVDSLGLPQRSYSPHISQLVLETSTIANVSLLTVANFAPVVLELGKIGTKVEVYLTANGTAPTVAGITGTPAVAFFPVMEYGLTETV